MIGPAVFLAVFMVEGWLRPGYDPLSIAVSELSLGPRGWIQIASFLVIGASFLVFARGIAAEFKRGKASRAGPVLFAIIGLAILASGPFVIDPASTPRDQWSRHGTIHQLLGAIAFSLMPASCFVFWRRFCEDKKWQSLRWWTLAAGVIFVAAIVLMKVAQLDPIADNPVSPWMGLIQRVALITYFAWIAVVALRLGKTDLRPSATS